MSQKANPTAIGLFIVLGVALGIGALLLFSSGKLFRPREKYIVYFDSSLQGLNPGAPVKFRGVTIGAVAEVLIAHNQATNDYAMPVIIEVDRALAQSKSDKFLMRGDDTVKELVEHGLRAKLEAESLVTGLLYVELAINPKAEPPYFHQLTPEYSEIPAEPTDIQQLLSNLARLDIGGISDKLTNLLTRLESTLNELNVREINHGITNLLGSAERFIASPELTNSAAELKLALGEIRTLVRRLDSRVEPVADGMTNTLAQAQQTLTELQRGVQAVTSMVEPGAPLRADLRESLEQIGQAAAAISDLAEFLQRHPNAMLTGKKKGTPSP
jgi:paraquat-inducible protein B